MADNPENIVLLTIDALRWDHLSCYGYRRNTTPNLDRVARESQVFTQAYSASSHTREAVPALLTGEFPDRAVDSQYHLDATSIAADLQSLGFETGAFHSNPYLSRAFGFDEGFDEFDDDLYLGSHKLVALAQRALDKLQNRHYAPAPRINERALGWLDSTDGPRFLWNHYMDVHGPYAPPSSYTTMYGADRTDTDLYKLYNRAIQAPESITPDEQSLLVDCYDGEIRFLDHHVGAFLDALKERGLYEDSLIVITADHGDAFGERGYYEHPRYLHEELIHVPLLVVPSDEHTASRIETPVSLTEIVPLVWNTVSSENGVEGYQSWLESIPSAGGDRTVFAQASGEDENAHLRRFTARNRHEQATATYDMEQETVEITDRTSEEIADQLGAHIVERTERAQQEPRVRDVDADEVEDRLTALGYRD